MKRVMRIIISISIFVSVCMFIGVVQAQTASIPQLINYQGKLSDGEGNPIATAEYDLSFSIFTEPTGGEAAWGPQIFDGAAAQGHGEKVPVVQGYFNVILGPQDESGRNIGEAFRNKDTYLEITIVGDSPILPRQQILSTPYALNGVPAGTINAFAGPVENIPPGWLLCDGTAVNSLTYPALFSAIGITWGNGSNDADSATDFNLPDVRGTFLRGVDNGAGNDPDAASRIASSPGGNAGDNVGSKQNDQFASHNHGGGNHQHDFTASYNDGLGSGTTWGHSMINNGSFQFNVHADVRYSGDFIPVNGGNETRPKNVNVNYIIKY